MKLSKKILIGFIVALAIVSFSLLYLLRGNNPINNDTARRTLINKKTSILVNNGIFAITKDTLKSFNIKKETTTNNKVVIVASISLEDLKTGGGSLNKYLINNDMKYSLSGNINLNYSKDHGEWTLSNIVPSNVIVTKTEINVMTKDIPFKKSNNQIIEDFKKYNVGIPLSSDKSTFTIALTNNSTVGYIPVDTIKEFKIVNLADQGNFKVVKIHLNIDFTRNTPNNMYEDNGKYSSIGEITVLYQLQKDSKGKYSWVYSSLVTNQNSIKTNKSIN